MSILLIDIPQNSKIICDCTDGSKYVIFHHIDGMYSFCTTENGNTVHLYCMTKLKQSNDSYVIENNTISLKNFGVYLKKVWKNICQMIIRL
jgi:parallel beta-helix repeat protein